MKFIYKKNHRGIGGGRGLESVDSADSDSAQGTRDADSTALAVCMYFKLYILSTEERR